MNNSKNIIDQIKIMCQSVTENTYNTEIRKGFELLVKLYDLGIDRECVYQTLLKYHNNLEDGISRDFIEDILDFVTGWCSPQNYIWKN